MKEILKNAFKVIIPIIFLVVGIFLGQDLVNLTKTVNENTPVTIVQDAQEINVSLMLDYGNSKVVTYSNVLLEEDKTVFGLLKVVADKNNLEFSYSDKFKDLGVFIESINDVGNDLKNDMWWHYWINNDYAKIAADQAELKNKDVVEWKFIRNQFDMTQN